MRAEVDVSLMTRSLDGREEEGLLLTILSLVVDVI